MVSAAIKNQPRSEAQIREHYEVEKELAAVLRNASKEERKVLYTSLYDELFQRVPHHSQLTRKVSAGEQRKKVERQLEILGRLLTDDTVYLEIGPGDCALALHISERVKAVYAIDVSETITAAAERPANFQLLISDGCSIPVPAGSVNVAYSNQLIEHLHPDDVYEQLENVFAALAPGGQYLCLTPNRLDGPHDISKFFDQVSTGFHLREYSMTELAALFKQVGFAKVMVYLGAQGKYVRFPIWPAVCCEFLLDLLPRGLAKRLASARLIRTILSINLVGIKAA